MQAILVIPGRLPALNDYVKVERSRAGRHLAAQLKRETETMIQWCIKAQLRGVQFKNAVHIDYRWVEENRKRDKDNIAFAKKFIQDSLVSSGVLQNDGWRWIDSFSDDFAVDKKNPRVEVLITEVEDEV